MRNSVTRTAIGKASIHLIPVDGSAGYKGTTSAAGTFHFEGIESGTYRIQVERAGYRDSQFAAIQSGWAGAILHFSAGQKLSGAEILLSTVRGDQGQDHRPGRGAFARRPCERHRADMAEGQTLVRGVQRRDGWHRNIPF